MVLLTSPNFLKPRTLRLQALSNDQPRTIWEVHPSIRFLRQCGPDNHAYLRELGAVPVDYHGDLEAELRDVAPEGVDAALIAVGGEEPIRPSVALTGDAARVVTTAFDPASDRYDVRRIGTQRSTERLSTLTPLYDEGKLRVPVRTVDQGTTYIT